MTAALAGRVDAAVAGLDRAERRALERRERDEAPYADIAAELDVKREQVADLLVAARLAVAESVGGDPPAERLTPQCGPARRVVAAHQDGEAVGARDLQRASAHIDGCEPCQGARRALLEARLACRAWSDAPPAPAPARAAAVTVIGGSRARLAAIAVAGLLALVGLIAVVGGGDTERTPPAPAAPPVGEGSADADAEDVVPPPGEQFCAPGEPGCE